MNKSLFWRTVLVGIIVAWAVYTLYPLTSVNLIAYFDKEAKNKDAEYQSYFGKVIEQTNTVRSAYLNLRETARAMTVDLGRYFPGNKYYRPNIKDKNQAILTVLQGEAQ